MNKQNSFFLGYPFSKKFAKSEDKRLPFLKANENLRKQLANVTTLTPNKLKLNMPECFSHKRNLVKMTVWCQWFH